METLRLGEATPITTLGMSPKMSPKTSPSGSPAWVVATGNPKGLCSGLSGDCAPESRKVSRDPEWPSEGEHSESAWDQCLAHFPCESEGQPVKYCRFLVKNVSLRSGSLYPTLLRWWSRGCTKDHSWNNRDENEQTASLEPGDNDERLLPLGICYT